jgi:hypothetical protein
LVKWKVEFTGSVKQSPEVGYFVSEWLPAAEEFGVGVTDTKSRTLIKYLSFGVI